VDAVFWCWRSRSVKKREWLIGRWMFICPGQLHTRGRLMPASFPLFEMIRAFSVFQKVPSLASSIGRCQNFCLIWGDLERSKALERIRMDWRGTKIPLIRSRTLISLARLLPGYS
jgi:hypothetical protein